MHLCITEVVLVAAAAGKQKEGEEGEAAREGKGEEGIRNKIY